ncbi:MAG: beta-hydroxyacyl-ACP dehydratase, partial [Burkholderiales bacterium]
MKNLPLIRGHRAGAVFAYRERQPIGVDRFLQDVAQLAALLPARRHILNLCEDRYHFAVGFCAALLQRQISLLPPNHAPDLVAQLVEHYPDVYCLTDTAEKRVALHTLFYPAPADAPCVPVEVPRIPAGQIAAIVFTSGSTGQPVPNEKSWHALVRGAAAELRRLGLGAFDNMAVLATVPPQHMYGLESSVLM